MRTVNVSTAEKFDADSQLQLPKPDGKPGDHSQPIKVYVMLGNLKSEESVNVSLRPRDQ